MSRALCLVALAACSAAQQPAGGMRVDAPPIETDAPAPDGRAPEPDAPGPSPDAPTAAPDAPTAAPDAPTAAPDAPCPDCPCVPARLTVRVSPHTSAPTPVGSPAHFDVAVTNNDSATCAPSRYEMRTRLAQEGIDVTPSNSVAADTGPLLPGATTHLTITATANGSFDGQTIAIPFDLDVPESTEEVFIDRVELEVAEPSGCHVSIPREILITDPSVVDDPVRTGFAAPADPRTGAWTFKRLVEDMAPTPGDAPAMVEAMLASLTASETINGFVVPPRAGIQAQILDRWPRLPGGALDLGAAPFRLLAIVNRFDLRNLDRGDAGEGRFVFGFLDGGLPTQATIIFEYRLPAASEADVARWAQAFHALGALTFSEEYNAALQALTESFTGRGARPSATNGSAIDAVRTNEIAFGDDGNWELREFALSPLSGMLEPRAVELTPDLGLNGSDALARFVNANAAAILVDQHTVPDLFEGRPFRGGASLNDASVWTAPGILDPEARHHFALNTCSGCHLLETGATFLHISPRQPGFASRLSGFLTGKTVLDPVTQEARTFNDLARRRADLEAIVCQPAGASLRHGIDRVH